MYVGGSVHLAFLIHQFFTKCPHTSSILISNELYKFNTKTLSFSKLNIYIMPIWKVKKSKRVHGL